MPKGKSAKGQLSIYKAYT